MATKIFHGGFVEFAHLSKIIDDAEEYVNVLKECKRSLKNAKWNSEDECLQALRQRINNSEKLDPRPPSTWPTRGYR